MRLAVLLSSAWMFAAPASAQHAPPLPALGAPFVEHFAALDETRWQRSNRDPSWALFSASWRPSQVAPALDGLEITLDAAPATDAPKPYISGEISTHEAFRYGYYEARLRAVRGGGMVSAFFTFALPPVPNAENEIDMELTGNAVAQIELTYHVNGQHIREIVPLGFDASEGFHAYAFDWRRDAIRWYIDNRLVHTSRAHVRELNRPQQIFTSLWNSVRMPRWLGPYDANAGAHTMTVACIAHAARYSGRALCEPSAR